MRKPPRKRGEDIISRRVVGRVIFSASIIVLGTLFIYSTAWSDSRMSGRDQTMVRCDDAPMRKPTIDYYFQFDVDIHMFCFSRPRLRSAKSRPRLRANSESNASDHRRGIIYRAACTCLRASLSGSVPNGSFGMGRLFDSVDACGYGIYTARRPAALRTAFECRRSVCFCIIGDHGMRRSDAGQFSL